MTHSGSGSQRLEQDAVISAQNWCNAVDAASYLGVSPKTLEHWRQTGGGPRYAKAGRRCLYRLDWLNQWLEGRSVSSTAEARRSGLS